MDSAAEVKLFTFRYSPFAQRAAIALKEKQISFEAIEVDFANKPRELLDANPIYKKVPTIIHNGNAVAESVVILEYLEDAFPQQVPLMPEDTYEKSKVRFWIDYVYKGFSSLAVGFRTKPGTPEKQAAKEDIDKSVKTLEGGMISFSEDGPFFAGERFGLLDVALAPLCMAPPLLKKLGGIEIPGPDEVPRLHRWMDVVKVHPSVSSTIPPEGDALDFMTALFQKMGLV
ncbi:unnamed protein product [Calypogeia fissa]